MGSSALFLGHRQPVHFWFAKLNMKLLVTWCYSHNSSLMRSMAPGSARIFKRLNMIPTAVPPYDLNTNLSPRDCWYMESFLFWVWLTAYFLKSIMSVYLQWSSMHKYLPVTSWSDIIVLFFFLSRYLRVEITHKRQYLTAGNMDCEGCLVQLNTLNMPS